MKQYILSFFLAIAFSFSADAEEFSIGVQMPLSGSMARAGNGFLEGVQTATEIFNRGNGQHKIKLITIDDESSPAKGVAAVEKLAAEGVAAIIGGYGSNVIGPASDAANKLKLVYITAGGVSEDLTRRGFKTFFRINNTAGYEKALLTLFAELGIKSVSIVYSTKDSTAALARDVGQSLTDRNVKTFLHPFDPAISDFKPVINKIRLQDKPEAILMCGYENDYVGIIRAAKVLKPEIKTLVGIWSLATPRMAKDFPDLMPNVIGTSMLPYPVEYDSKEGRQFADTYKKLFNKEVDYLPQFGYVMAQLLFEAVARAADSGALKKDASDAIATELRKTNRLTLIGRVSFDANGDNPNFAQRMGQHQNGKVVIVSPKRDATGSIVYPGVPW